MSSEHRLDYFTNILRQTCKLENKLSDKRDYKLLNGETSNELPWTHLISWGFAFTGSYMYNVHHRQLHRVPTQNLHKPQASVQYNITTLHSVRARPAVKMADVDRLELSLLALL